MGPYPPLLFQKVRQIQILQINHAKPQNPVNDAIRLALCEAIRDADEDPNVVAIVLTGGIDRSFCAGGDFAEVSQLDSAYSVQAWIDAVLEMYIAVLAVTKPMVMAIDGYAIGLGLQLALMGDWRVASNESRLSMWELKAGVACTVGACILHHCLGRHAATQLIYGCELLSGEEALKKHLVEEVVQTAELQQRAIERAEQFACYPTVPFSATKRSINAPFIEKLRESRRDLAKAHIESFAARSSERHMNNILGR